MFFTSPSTPERNNLNDQILNAIDEEIAKLRQARAILTDAAKTPVSKSATTASPAVIPKGKTRRKLSPKARKAIADAQRKRWAKVKSQKKAAAAAVVAKKEPAAS
jgi:predicted neutral ceramidase superfamily lipid hydrolase